VKTIDISQTTTDKWVKSAQSERVVITRNGRPIALVIGVEGLDREQIELGASDRFWKLVRKRRKEKTITREELEKRLRE
jgi:antitoxin (DNA-binding transcriptional repressor) of toxin-antitoxin stability system